MVLRQRSLEWPGKKKAGASLTMKLNTNTLGLANASSKPTAEAAKTPQSAQEDLSTLDRFNPSQESYYLNDDVVDITNKTKAGWSMGQDGQSIERYALEQLAIDGPVEVSFQRRVPDISQPERSKLRRLAESVGVGVAATLALTAFPLFLVMDGEKLPNTFSQTYTDAKYPWKEETVKGEFSIDTGMAMFQADGMRKVELGLTADAHDRAFGH